MIPNKTKGILLILLMATLAQGIASVDWLKSLGLSPIIIGVILGIIVANTLASRIPQGWREGIKFCAKTILRLSIIFYGFRLTLSDVISVGTGALWVDLLVVCSTLGIGVFVGKLLKIERPLSLLISAGGAICGAAAVLATEPVVKAKSHQTVVAIATVVIFGTLSMFIYPLLYRLGLFSHLSPQQMGIYTGATVHEVAHVVGAGNAMGTSIAGVATITKMIRVILLAPALLALSYWGRDTEQSSEKSTISIPWFAVFFLLMIGVNTLLSIGANQIGCFDGYQRAIDSINTIDTFGLTMAMTAIGIDASVAKFREAGVRPFLLAFCLYLWLTVGGYCLVYLLA